jgi:hypothetical protein
MTAGPRACACIKGAAATNKQQKNNLPILNPPERPEYTVRESNPDLLDETQSLYR